MINRTTTESNAQPLTDQAYEAVRAMILDLRLLPGVKLVVQDLAAKLGMSRTPVREALVRLAHEGLVETIPYKGTSVTVPSVRTLHEAYEIIQGVEGQAVKLAAERADEGANAAAGGVGCRASRGAHAP